MPDGSLSPSGRVYRRDDDGRFAPGPVRLPTAARTPAQAVGTTRQPAEGPTPVAAAYQRYTAASTSVDTEPVTLLDVNGTARRIAPGDLDDARWHLTMGNCHSFAAALHARTGLPIVVFRALGDDEEEDEDGYGHITHVGVATPDGYLLDAHGRVLITEVEEAELVEADVLPDGVAGLVAEIEHDTRVLGRRWQPLDVDRVASFVDPLLAQIAR